MTSEARRERRMRRVIEHGGTRIEKIHNLFNETPKDLKTESACEAVSHTSTFVDQNNQEPPLNELSASLTSIFQNGNFSGVSSPSVRSTETESHKKNLRIIVVMALATFTTILQLIILKLSDSYDLPYSNHIFTPFLLYEFINLFMLKTNPPINNISFIISMFARISPRVSGRIMNIMSTITTFIQDLMIYFFVYVFINLFIDIVC
nr:uncharacterized protein LOC111417156 [Onthophagus taurus]